MNPRERFGDLHLAICRTITPVLSVAQPLPRLLLFSQAKSKEAMEGPSSTMPDARLSLAPIVGHKFGELKGMFCKTSWTIALDNSFGIRRHAFP